MGEGLEERRCSHDMGVRKSKQLVAAVNSECTPGFPFTLTRAPDDQLGSRSTECGGFEPLKPEN